MILTLHMTFVMIPMMPINNAHEECLGVMHMNNDPFESQSRRHCNAAEG